MAHGKKRSRAAQALPWVIVALMLCWIAFEATPREIRAEHDLVPSSDRFDYGSWHSELELSRSNNGIAVLGVTETITAEFPDSDENTGIVREISVFSPRYIHDLEVRDADGAAVPFSTEHDDDDGTFYIRTGTDEYVHGDQTYVIDYVIDQRLFRLADSGMEEFYRDLLPLDSDQSIGEFSSTLRVSAELSEELNGHTACYQGRYGSSDRCELETSVEDDGTTVYQTSSGYRPAGDEVTIGVGFEEGTFSNLRSPEWEEPTRTALIFDRYATASMSFAVLILALALATGLRRISTQRIVNSRTSSESVPVREVPASMPPPVAAALMRRSRDKTFTPIDNIGNAQIVHMAVQGAVRFESTPSGQGSDDVSIRLSDRYAVQHELDERTLRLLCPELKPDSVHEVPKNSQSFSSTFTKVVTDGDNSAADQGLLTRARRHLVLATFGVLCVLLAMLGFALLSNWLRVTASQTVEGFSILGGAIALIVTIALSWSSIRPPLQPTKQGWDAVNLLKGVRAYLVQRRDQEADAAESDSDTSAQGIERDEKLLPYAMLLGMGGEWEEILKRNYRAAEIPPVWSDVGGRDFRHLWSKFTARSHSSTA